MAHAYVSFTKAPDTGGSEEILSSLATQAAAQTEFDAFVAAADSCHSLGAKVDPSTTISLTGTPLSLPTVGDDSRAYRCRGAVQGQTAWLDALVFRSGGTLAMVTAGALGGAPDSGWWRWSRARRPASSTERRGSAVAGNCRGRMAACGRGAAA